jgi:long-chain fatty acid transport protein
MNPGRRLFLALLLATASVEAQPFTIPTVDFSFSNPGARSLGFGGAFAALADDATAAYANPAGLVQLTGPEVSVEGRLWQRSPQFIAGGRVDGVPTGRGIDTRPFGIAFERDESQDLGPSFASVVIPKGRWSFALYGHQLAQYEMQSDFQGFFSEVDLFPSVFGIRSPGSRESTELEVVTAGAAAAWRMNDRLSFGLGLVFSDVSLATSSGAYLPDDESEQSQYAEISYLPERRLSLSTLSIDGTDVTFNAGALWRLSERFSAGLFYRQGAEVEGTSFFQTGPVSLFPGLPPLDETFRNEAVFKVPDVAGVGLAYRSSDGAVTITTQIDHVSYGTLVRVVASEDLEVDNDDFGNALEYHIGAEYALLRSTPILAFRAGAWVEPNWAVLFETDEVTHLSAGLGIATAIGQIDLAGDFSERGDTASLSVIYNF